MNGLSETSLVIGIADSPAERVRLARLLVRADALLLVSSAEQARAFLNPRSSGSSVTEPVVHGPMTEPMTEPIEGPAAEPVTEEPAPDVPATGAPEGDPAGGDEPVGLPPIGLNLDAARRVARWRDREVALTRLEHDVLHCLAGSPGQVWTHRRLHLAVWGNDHVGRGSHIHSVVKRLRRKLACLDAVATIVAVRGVGFRLVAQP